MRTLKNELSVMLSRTVGSKNVLAAITEDEEEMALMNLTLLKRKPKLYTYYYYYYYYSSTVPMIA